MTHARYLVGDVFEQLATLDDNSVDLVLTSPPFLALRSYLPADHPDKSKEIGSEATPAEFIDRLLDVVEALDRVLAPHGSICIELGDTYSGSGGAGGDYNENGLHEGQEAFVGSGILNQVSRRTSMVNDRTAEESRLGVDARNRGRRGGNARLSNTSDDWPEAKSLCLIPETFRWALVYGRNPHNGRITPRWRARNVIRWVRPNPPVGALGDKFRPATSEMVVLCKSRDRYFDLDAVRTPSDYDRPNLRGNGSRAGDAPPGQKVNQSDHTTNPAGAPPLDWWNIPTQPNEARSVRRVRVPVDAAADGIQRTTSPDCPQHGSPDHQGSNAPDDAHVDSGLSRTAHTASRPARAPADDSPPTPLTLDLTASNTAPDGLAATTHNSPSRKTGHAAETTSPGMPSARTPRHTVDISTGPELSAPRPDKPSNNNGEAYPFVDDPETVSRIARTQDPSSACTCSYYVDIEVGTYQDNRDYATWPSDMWVIPTQPYRESHYATFPEQLCITPIKAMSPLKVCRQCGQPSRRIVERTEEYQTFRDRQLRTIAEGGNTTRDKAVIPTGFTNAGTAMNAEYVTVGWSDCGHNNWRPGVVLEPFAGSGTTLQVATGHGRDAIGIDLDPRNAELAINRIGPLFLTIEGDTSHDYHTATDITFGDDSAARLA